MPEFSLSPDEQKSVATAISQKGAKAWEDPNLQPIRERMKRFRREGQQYQCCYCRQVTPQNHGYAWTLDHILSRDGYSAFTYDIRNIFLACHDCNGSKSTKNVFTRKRAPQRYPAVSSAFSIIHPKFDDYDSHMMILLEGYYFPTSKKGIRTMDVCGLDRYNARFDINTDSLARMSQILVDKLTSAVTHADRVNSVLAMGLIINKLAKQFEV